MKKRSFLFSVVLVSLGSIIGCGGNTGDMVEAEKPSPVGGAMIRLPQNTGLVAIKTEAPDAPRAGKKKSRATSIVAIFFDNDGSTPMSPPPTEVIFELEALNAKAPQPKPVTLEPDPAAPNRFVSAAGVFPGGVAGKLRAKIGGKDIEEEFSAR